MKTQKIQLAPQQHEHQEKSRPEAPRVEAPKPNQTLIDNINLPRVKIKKQNKHKVSQCPTRSTAEVLAVKPNQDFKHPKRNKVRNTNTILSNTVLSIESGKLEEDRCLRIGKDKKDWINSFVNELGLLTQGIRDVQGTK